MKVGEYALSVDLTVAEVLKKAQELGIEVKNAEDLLSDDDIIILDNAIDLISTDTESTLEDDEDILEVVESMMNTSKIQEMNDKEKKQKLKKKSQINNNQEDYLLKRKQMYKHKEKLISNENTSNVLIYKNNMTVKELADVLGVNGNELIKKLMGLGQMISLNEVIDYETASILSLEYNKTLKKEETQDITNFENYEIDDDESSLEPRPPVVTIMGHVDHGKTSLLDYLRNTKVTETEAGGITQAIGAYQIEHDGKKITFIDTPGHAAFTQMRARGASVTDIVIIIVAADDGVMPQTEEAIDHAKEANVPIIVAVNKIDKPNANPEKIRQEMTELGIVPEEWGGAYPFVDISAKTGEGIDLLLETILTISEVNNFKANKNRYAIGTVIESRVDKHMGPTVSLLIQNGTLRLGDPVVIGNFFGKIRTMKNDLGQDIVESGPSSPVEVTGISDAPSAGDKFMSFETEAEAKKIAMQRSNLENNNKTSQNKVTLDDLFNKVSAGEKEVNVVLKCDVRGSEEAIRSALEKIDISGVSVKVIRSGVGGITESDVILANASKAIIIGFNVNPSNITKEIAKEYNVEIRLYTIIYKIVEDMEAAITGMLDPEYVESELGTAEIRKIFKFSKVGNIAGCYVTSGVIKNNSLARVVRDDIIIYEGKIASVQREKDTQKEVKKGFECGITLENFSDIKEGDIIISYEMVEAKK